MLTEWQFSDRDCEILLVGGKAVVLDRSQSRYFQTNTSKLSAEIREAMTPKVSQISLAGALSFVFTIIFLLSINFLFSIIGETSKPSGWLILILALYLPLSVIIHELAHALALRLMGQSIDRFGFKLNYWIFPAFYVRMNQSLLLGRNEKVIVHGAGVFINLVINALLFLLNYFVFHLVDLQMALQFVFLTLAINAIPALKSDGYRVLLALTGIDEIRGLRRNPWWIVTIKTGSVTYVFCYFIYMISTIIVRFIP